MIFQPKINEKWKKSFFNLNKTKWNNKIDFSFINRWQFAQQELDDELSDKIKFFLSLAGDESLRNSKVNKKRKCFRISTQELISKI